MKTRYTHDYASLQYKIKNKLWNWFNPKSGKKGRRLWCYRAWYHAIICKCKESETRNNIFLSQRSDRCSGIGVNFENIWCGYCSAKLFEVKYAYSTLPDMELDKLLALGEGEVSADRLLKEDYKKVRLPYFSLDNENEISLIKKMIDSYSGKKIVFFLEDKQVIQRKYWLSNRYILVEKFWNASIRDADPSIYSTDCLNIAMHIRRGDAGEYSPVIGLEEWWLDNEYYIQVMKRFLECEYILNVSKRIFVISEGDENLFDTIVDYAKKFGVDVTFVLNQKVSLSWLYMIKADVLITGSSSFSYMAALFNKNIIVSPENRFQYPEEKQWLIANRNGKLSVDDAYIIQLLKDVPCLKNS